MKIDIFNHVIPPKYKLALEQKLPKKNFEFVQSRCVLFPELVDFDKRFIVMDKHDGMVQVLSLLTPFVEKLVSSDTAVELVRLGNDGLEIYL